MDQQLGGTAVYGSIGARIWSDSVGICTVVGRDYAPQVRSALSDAGIDTEGVREVPRRHGLVWFTGYLDGDERVDDVKAFSPERADPGTDRYVQSGTARHRRLWPIFSPSVTDIPVAYGAARGTHLAPMSVRQLTTNAGWFHGRGTRVSVDWPFWRGERQKTLNRVLLACVDSVLPSAAEIEQFHPGPMADTVEKIATAGPQIIIVKRGSAGVRVFDTGMRTVTDIPAYPTVVRDPTGAGDAFCGGYTVGLDETNDPVHAAVYGVVSSSFVIENFGALHALKATRTAAEKRRHHILKSMANSSASKVEAASR